MADISEYEKIHTYVTRPKQPVTICDNGNISISPIGFPEVNFSGSPNDGTCVPETMPVTVIPSFSTSTINASSYEIVFAPTANIDLNRGGIVVKSKQFKYDAQNKFAIMRLDADITSLLDHNYLLSIEVIATTDDDMVTTKIPGSLVDLSKDITVTPAGYTTFYIDSECVYDYELNNYEFGLLLNIDPDSVWYAAIENQDNASENGLYRYAECKWYRLGSYTTGGENISIEDRLDPLKYYPANPSSNDNVFNCLEHFRKSYSDREVMDFVEDKMGTITHFGVHPAAGVSMECAGNFIRWFTSKGIIDLGNGKQNTAYVNGFGLGTFYSNTGGVSPCVPEDKHEDENTRHPWMLWAYGSKWSNRTADNIPALPRDWPFTNCGGVVSTHSNNNITLITKANIDGGTVGNLETEDEDGNPVRIDRHHIVVYNDLTNNTGSIPSGYKDGSTVIKPLFIHLPAPMTTKDGDTFEITVSLQNVNVTDAAFNGDNGKADLSAYYAFLSQPRVYVMGGTQKFSCQNVKIMDSDISIKSANEFLISFNKPLTDADGNPFFTNQELRINLCCNEASPYERFFNAVVYSYNPGGPMIIKCTGTFPYNNFNGRKWKKNQLYISEVAYLDRNETNNPTNTSMGLLSRQDAILGNDYGEGGIGDLDEFNKFFSREERNGAITFEKPDKRYVLATVYQTPTNTFPWNMQDRRRMKYAHMVMTDEFENGPESIVANAWKLNKELLETEDYRLLTYDTEAHLKLMANVSPVTYGNSASIATKCSTIGSKVRVTLADNIVNAGVTQDNYNKLIDDCGQPVRQAKLAYNNLLSDIFNARACNCESAQAYKDYYNSSRIYIGTGKNDRNAPALSSNILSDPVVQELDKYNASYLYKKIWESKLRNIPNYAMHPKYVNESYDEYHTTYNQNNIPFDTDDLKKYLEYSDYNSSYEYNTSLSSVGCVEDVSCSLIGIPSTGRVYYPNSAVRSLWDSYESECPNCIWYQPHYKDKNSIKNDMMRHAELGLIYDAPQSATDAVAWRESNQMTQVWNPFAQIYSIDYVPCPIYSNVNSLPNLSDDQKAYIGCDMVQQFRYLNSEYNGENFVSEQLPLTDDAHTTVVGEFIKHYVPAISHSLTSHFHNSIRILLKDNRFDSDSAIYRRLVKWICEPYETCYDGLKMINRYLNDSFAQTYSQLFSMESAYDFSLDCVNLESDGAVRLENNISAPPYSTYQNKYIDFGETYTRVFMQFTFSGKAGRWYTTDYRQYPTNYLSPLVGAKTFNAKLPTIYNENGVVDPTNYAPRKDYVWRNSSCDGVFSSYTDTLIRPYSSYPPMDITLGCVPHLYGNGNFPFDDLGKLKTTDGFDNNFDCANQKTMTRLHKYYKPIEDGGVSVFPPSDANGNYRESTDKCPHANLWSVRKFLRPAVSVLGETDVPSYYEEGNRWLYGRTDGIPSDSTLYGMFDFPRKGHIDYVIPSTTAPFDPTDVAKLAYLDDTGNGLIDQVERNEANLGNILVAESDLGENQ